MKINILVGARFQAGQLAEVLDENKFDIEVYTSTHPNKWKIAKDKVKFVPLLSNIFRYITKIKLPMSFEEQSIKIFDALSCFYMRKSNVLHVWSSYGLSSIKNAKKNNVIVFVEKACPHPLYQEKLLLEEASILGIEHKTHSEKFMKRTLEEFELADKVIVPSMYTYNSFIEYGFDRDKLVNVTLDANFKPKKDHKKKYSKEQSFIVGTVGGNILRKGFLYLIDAWQELGLKNAKLLLKTSQKELEDIPLLWNKIKDDNSIEVIGYLKDMETFYEQCDLFCLPSVDEGFGMVVFEAIACSVPVIVTKNVGAADLIKDGEIGHIVDIRSVVQLKDKISRYYDNRQELQLLSDNCIRFYKEYQNNNDNYKNRVLNLYADYSEVRT